MLNHVFPVLSTAIQPALRAIEATHVAVQVEGVDAGHSDVTALRLEPLGREARWLAHGDDRIGCLCEGEDAYLSELSSSC